MPSLPWIVQNALSRDVERQHLNRILADIRTSVEALAKTSSTSGSVSGNIKDTVGQMVDNNTEAGISVTYDVAAKVLNFAVSSFSLNFTGDVTGSGSGVPGGGATIQLTIDPDLLGISDAPNDSLAYWRRTAAWEEVGNNLEQLQVIQGSGFPAANYDPATETSEWNMRTLQEPAAGFTITDPDGATGDPTFALADDLAAVEGLVTTGLATRTAADTWTTRTITAGAGIDVADGDGVAGNPTVSHEDTSSVADITATFTGGTVPDVISITFDTFGHVVSRTISGRTLDHNDTGALQGGNSTERYHLTAAEHTGLLLWVNEDPTDYALITQTITNGDTTHAPSGDAVFDALALKADDSNVMHLTGNETATGVKTFSDRLVVGSSNNSVGFTPSLLVEFQDTTAVASGTFVRYGNNANSPFNLGFKARGTAATPSQTLSGDGLFAMRGGGWHSGGAFGNTQAAEIIMVAAEDFTSTAQGTIIRFRVAVTGATSATTRLTVDSNGDVFLTGGRLYGTAIHNHASGLAGTTNEYIGSGTYTPTLTNVANVSGTTSAVAQWMRVGNVVTVSGRIAIATTAAAATLTQLRISLPIASATTTTTQIAGTASRRNAAAVDSGQIESDTVNDAALLSFFSSATASAGTSFQFTYLVV